MKGFCYICFEYIKCEKHDDGKWKPIKVCIPVNLKKYFPKETEKKTGEGDHLKNDFSFGHQK